jgi:arylsulfatase A-like enzyme
MSGARFARVLGAALLAGGFLALVSCTPPATEARPNVLLVSIDTLRLDRLTCYGGPAGNSPRIDRLAEEGVRFASVQAPRGLTWPSMTTILTGLHPRTHGVRLNGEMLGEEPVTLAETLAGAGYDTAAFLSNMCDARNLGFASSFCAWWMGTTPPAERGRRQWASHDQSRWDRAITDEAVRFIKTRRAAPFLAWVHYVDAHKPFDPVPDLMREEGDATFVPDDPTLDRATLERIPLSAEAKKRLLAIYDSQIAGIDREIGRLLDALAEAGLSENTIVVLTADHGEELGDHQDYFYHLASVYQQVLSIPWIVRWPGRLPAARLVGENVAALDIAPTILDLAGLAPPAGVEGVSRAGLARGDSGAEGTPLTFAEWADQIVVVGEGSWRYIWNPNAICTFGLPYGTDTGKCFRIGVEELYDLGSDPLQMSDLLARHPDRAAALRRRACAFVGEKDFTHGQAVVDEEVRERLNSLGYVQEEGAAQGTSLAAHCRNTP